MVAKKYAYANIVPFIKAFKPNMKLMHDVHIWPDVHSHDAQQSHGGQFFSSSISVLFQESPWKQSETRRALYSGE